MNRAEPGAIGKRTLMEAIKVQRAPAVNSVTMVKRNGRWIIEEPAELQALHYMHAVKCSVLPNGEVEIRDPDDLSDTYGYLKPYIFNKKTLVIFTTPAQFFADAGRSSFVGLKYDMVSRLPSGLHFVDGRALTAADVARIEGR